MSEQEEQTLQDGFLIGDWRVEPDSGRLLRGADEVKLEPKVMEVLLCLAQSPGKVVTRETLEETVWAGTIVGYDAITASIIKLRKALQDDTRNPTYIETVSKKGYRLIAPIRTTGNQDSTDNITSVDDGVPDNPFERKSSILRAIMSSKQILVSILILSGLFYALYTLNQGKQQHADGGSPTVVVLPFENLSNDSTQDYFSDGITDDLITDLSKINSLRVIARQSAYHYKSREQYTLDDVANELQVQYIVRGSVQKHGQRVRINVQLINVNDGDNVWAERFETVAEKLFATQDSITHQVIQAMTLTLTGDETRLSKSSKGSSFEAYDAFLLGQKYASQRSREGFDAAMQEYKRAIELDANFARAYGAMAVVLTYGYRFQWTELPLVEARERALQLAKKAVSLDTSSPQIYWALGYTHIHRKEYAEAEAAAQKSIELSPSYADGYGLLAYISNWRGKAQQAEHYIKKATELNPYHSFDYPWNLGLSYYSQGRYKEAITALREALERNPNVLYPRLFLTASYVRAGQMDDATWQIDNIMTARPDTTLAHLQTVMPFEHDEQKSAFLKELRKAGIPEK